MDAQTPLPAEALPAALSYASAGEAPAAALAAVAKRLLVLSILSGLCVGVCFLPAFSEDLLARLFHVLVFATTIGVAIHAGVALRALEGPQRSALRQRVECVALMGLLLLTFLPFYFNFGAEHQGSMVAAGSAFTLLSVSAWRHLLLYRLLARECRFINARRTAGFLLLLGWIKALFETAWLGSCAIALWIAGLDRQSEDMAIFFAVGAAFGCMGFGGIWLMMIVQHALLVRTVKRQDVYRGFAVEPPPTVLRAEPVEAPV